MLNIERWSNNQINTPDVAKFQYVVEISAWEDTGTTGYIGLKTGTISQSRAILEREIGYFTDWYDEEVLKGNLSPRTSEPEICNIRIRPPFDADGDLPPLNEWDID
jgi:hypothetical protein